MTERYRPHRARRPGSPTHSCAAARPEQQARRHVPAEIRQLAAHLVVVARPLTVQLQRAEQHDVRRRRVQHRLAARTGLLLLPAAGAAAERSAHERLVPRPAERCALGNGPSDPAANVQRRRVGWPPFVAFAAEQLVAARERGLPTASTSATMWAARWAPAAARRGLQASQILIIEGRGYRQWNPARQHDRRARCRGIRTSAQSSGLAQTMTEDKSRCSPQQLAERPGISSRFP